MLLSNNSTTTTALTVIIFSCGIKIKNKGGQIKQSGTIHILSLTGKRFLDNNNNSQSMCGDQVENSETKHLMRFTPDIWLWDSGRTSAAQVVQHRQRRDKWFAWYVCVCTCVSVCGEGGVKWCQYAILEL